MRTITVRYTAAFVTTFDVEDDDPIVTDPDNLDLVLEHDELSFSGGELDDWEAHVA